MPSRVTRTVKPVDGYLESATQSTRALRLQRHRSRFVRVVGERWPCAAQKLGVICWDPGGDGGASQLHVSTLCLNSKSPDNQSRSRVNVQPLPSTLTGGAPHLLCLLRQCFETLRPTLLQLQSMQTIFDSSSSTASVEVTTAITSSSSSRC